MRIPRSLLLRILATLLTVGLLSYLGWWYAARHSNRPVFDMCFLAFVAFSTSLYLFWGAFPRKRDQWTSSIIAVGIKEDIIRELSSVLDQQGFDVRELQAANRVEANGHWWIFSERLLATIEQQHGDKFLVTVALNMKYRASFLTAPMFPFFPSIFATSRASFLDSRIRDVLK